MLEPISFLAISLASLAIIVRAISDYKGARSREMTSDFTTALYTNLLSFALLFITIFLYSIVTGWDGGRSANPLMIFANIALYSLLAYIFYKVTPSLNESKVAFALYAFSLALQIWYALGTPTPPSTLMAIGVLYFFGFHAYPRIGLIFGWMLRTIFPKADSHHEAWFASMKKGPLSKNNADRSLQVHIRNDTTGFYKFKFLPSNVAGALIAYALWNLLTFAAISILFG